MSLSENQAIVVIFYLVIGLIISHIGLIILFFYLKKKYESDTLNFISNKLNELSDATAENLSKSKNDLDTFNNDIRYQFASIKNDHLGFINHHSKVIEDGVDKIKQNQEKSIHSFEKLMVKKNKELNDLSDKMIDNYSKSETIINLTYKEISGLLDRISDSITAYNQIQPILKENYSKLELVANKTIVLIANNEKVILDAKEDTVAIMKEFKQGTEDIIKQIKSSGEQKINSAVSTNEQDMQKLTKHVESSINELFNNENFKQFTSTLNEVMQKMDRQSEINKELLADVKERFDSSFTAVSEQMKSKNNRKKLFGI